MKRPWAFICASEGATSKHLRNYCREVYLLGYLPVCPKLQDSQYLVLEDAVERSEYTAIVRDKLLRCPMLVVCSRNQDATTNAQIGLAQKYNRIVTTLDGLKKAVSEIHSHRHGMRQQICVYARQGFGASPKCASGRPDAMLAKHDTPQNGS